MYGTMTMSPKNSASFFTSSFTSLLLCCPNQIQKHSAEFKRTSTSVKRSIIFTYQSYKETSNNVWRLDQLVLHPRLPHGHPLSKVVASWKNTNEQLNWSIGDRRSLPFIRILEMFLRSETRVWCGQGSSNNGEHINIPVQRQSSGILKGESLKYIE